MNGSLSAPELALLDAPAAVDVLRRTPTRQLAAVAFVDIADSTNQLLVHGDHGWSAVLTEFHAACARTITEHRGRMVKTLGDGLLATFSTASDAIAALRVIRAAAARRGLTVRGAVHAAEIEVVGADITGVGVHVAARVEALTAPGELWVTSTVHDVVAGSRVRLDDRGEHELKGFDEPFQLYAVGELDPPALHPGCGGRSAQVVVTWRPCG